MNEYADTEAPLRVAHAGQIHWDGVADVIVAGHFVFSADDPEAVIGELKGL